MIPSRAVERRLFFLAILLKKFVGIYRYFSLFAVLWQWKGGENMELSIKDRLILSNQYKILKALTDDKREKEYYDQGIEILSSGYKHDYGMLVEDFDEEVDNQICQFVWDILALYSELNSSYEQLSPEDKKEIPEDELVFLGFDGNDEVQYYLYCMFILEKLKRYGELTQNRNDFNTHWPIVDRYKKMLEKRSQISTKKFVRLTKDQILEIISC